MSWLMQRKGQNLTNSWKITNSCAKCVSQFLINLANWNNIFNIFIQHRLSVHFVTDVLERWKIFFWWIEDFFGRWKIFLVDWRFFWWMEHDTSSFIIYSLPLTKEYITLNSYNIVYIAQNILHWVPNIENIHRIYKTSSVHTISILPT